MGNRAKDWAWSFRYLFMNCLKSSLLVLRMAKPGPKTKAIIETKIKLKVVPRVEVWEINAKEPLLLLEALERLLTGLLSTVLFESRF